MRLVAVAVLLALASPLSAQACRPDDEGTGGTCTLSDGSQISGWLQNDRPVCEGYGQISYPNGDVFWGVLEPAMQDVPGRWRPCLPKEGTMTFDDGSVFEGTWNGGDRAIYHGSQAEGTYTWPTGQVCDGTFDFSASPSPFRPRGFQSGTCRLPGGTVFTGRFYNQGAPSGYGRMLPRAEGSLVGPTGVGERGVFVRHTTREATRLEALDTEPVRPPGYRPPPVPADASAPPNGPAFARYQRALGEARTAADRKAAYLAYADALAEAGVAAGAAGADLLRQLHALFRSDFESGFKSYISTPPAYLRTVMEGLEQPYRRCSGRLGRWTTDAYIARQEGRTPPPRPVIECEGTPAASGPPPTPEPPPPAPGCTALALDLDAGTLNGIAPTADRDALEAQFPCATGETADGGPYNFGGGVFFLDHGFLFYTHRDYIEVRRGFAGTTQPDLLGRRLAAAGLPPPTRTAQGARLYAKRYGCLRVETDAAGVIEALGVHASSCGAVIIPR
ncbi:hypothetical protein [Rubrivirga sp. IMCC45206]|uniref:hypothetical protein n=1 Tax=Rubrivirga sp. IMCC45206 TaxID=3391614 RepID=UPI00398F9ECB